MYMYPCVDESDHFASTDTSRFYNNEDFSDVTILMLGARPSPCKAARKSVPPVYTFHAHKIIPSAGSRQSAEYFLTHPKVLDVLHTWLHLRGTS